MQHILQLKQIKVLVNEAQRNVEVLVEQSKKRRPSLKEFHEIADQVLQEAIKLKYQLNKLHSAIQNIRKEIKIRPWNKVLVVLDDTYATNNIKNDLYNTLSNVEIIITDFDSNAQNNYSEIKSPARSRALSDKCILFYK